MADWLDNIKVGDIVMVLTREGYVQKRVTKSSKPTVECGSQRFARKTGTERGSNIWHWSNLVEITPGVMEKWRHQQAVSKYLCAITAMTQAWQQCTGNNMSMDELERETSRLSEFRPKEEE